MIDFHTHILPNVDDGSQSVEESVKMLEELSLQGVDTVCLTPHFWANYDTVDSFLEKREKALEKLREQIESTDKDFPNLLLGAEVKYFTGVSRMDDLEKLRLEGTRLLLLEMPFSSWSNEAVKEVLEINSMSDFTVVLAHIERYLAFMKKGVLDTLIQNGVLIQSNAEFFEGVFSKRKALNMLACGQIDLLGTDCHNMQTRKPNMQVAFSCIEKKLGARALDIFKQRSDEYLKEWDL